MDRNWIMNPNRVALEYINGLNEFLDVAKDHMITENLSKIRCPCQKCRNLVKFEFDHVRGHLYRWGFDKLYRVWTFHGEIDRAIDDRNPVNEVECMIEPEEDKHMSDSEDDSFFDMFNDLRDAKMASGSGVMEHDDIGTSTKRVGGPRESYMSMFEEAHRELYPGCTTFSAFSFLVKLMHLKVLNGWNNKSFDMLLELLVEAFPNPNAIPCSHYEAKKMLKEFEVIDNEVESSRGSNNFGSLENSEPNQEISSDDTSLAVCEDLEVPNLFRIDVQPQHIDVPLQDMHTFIDEDEEFELESSEDEHEIYDDYSD